MSFPAQELATSALDHYRLHLLATKAIEVKSRGGKLQVRLIRLGSGQQPQTRFDGISHVSPLTIYPNEQLQIGTVATRIPRVVTHRGSPTQQLLLKLNLGRETLSSPGKR